MISEQTKKRLVKAGLAGAILGVGGTVLYGNGAIELAGMSVPTAVPLFVAGGGASLITDLVHDQLNMPTVAAQKFSDISSVAIAGGISGAAATGILKLVTDVPTENMIKLFALGFGSQVGADYIEYKFLEDSAGKLIF